MFRPVGPSFSTPRFGNLGDGFVPGNLPAGGAHFPHSPRPEGDGGRWGAPDAQTGLPGANGQPVSGNPGANGPPVSGNPGARYAHHSADPHLPNLG